MASEDEVVARVKQLRAETSCDMTDSVIDEGVLRWMELSVKIAKESISEAGKTKPKVGVVIVRNGELLGQSFRGETGEGRHAEFGLIERLGKSNLAGATVFTTLEPCSRRSVPKQPCAQHLIDAGVKRVYIGMYDPNPVIYREGWRMLRDAGIELRDYPDILREEIERDNASFVNSYRTGIGQRGSAQFDYTQNGGVYTLENGNVKIDTRWTARGGSSVYAIDNSQHVALARYAICFEEVD